MHCDLHLLKAFILSPEAEPSGAAEVIFARLWHLWMVHYCQTQKMD